MREDYKPNAAWVDRFRQHPGDRSSAILDLWQAIHEAYHIVVSIEVPTNVFRGRQEAKESLRGTSSLLGLIQLWCDSQPGSEERNPYLRALEWLGLGRESGRFLNRS